MPIVIAIVGILVVGAGIYLFTNQPARLDETEVAVAVDESSTTSDDGLSLDDGFESDTNVQISTEADEVVEALIEAETVVDTPTVRSVDASYLTPARTRHTITIKLTLSSDIVTDASVVYDDGAGFSNPHQERFDGAYKAEVIGKPLGDIRLSRVGGASLTSGAFNEAVQQIAAQL